MAEKFKLKLAISLHRALESKSLRKTTPPKFSKTFRIETLYRLEASDLLRKFCDLKQDFSLAEKLLTKTSHIFAQCARIKKFKEDDPA